MDGSPQVVIVNGAGSVGKTSIALALQTMAANPFLRVSMNVFADMLPERMSGHPDSMISETAREQGLPSVAIRIGPVLARAMRGMRHAIAVLAAQANHLVVDDVMLNAAEAAEYRSLLTHTQLRADGLFASLEVLEARERARGDRPPGLARWQLERVHRGQRHDLEIETSGSTPDVNAQRIIAASGSDGSCRAVTIRVLEFDTSAAAEPSRSS